MAADTPNADLHIGALDVEVVPGQARTVRLVWPDAVPVGTWTAHAGRDLDREVDVTVDGDDLVLTWSAEATTEALGWPWRLRQDGHDRIGGQVRRAQPQSTPGQDSVPVELSDGTTVTVQATVAGGGDASEVTVAAESLDAIDPLTRDDWLGFVAGAFGYDPSAATVASSLIGLTLTDPLGSGPNLDLEQVRDAMRAISRVAALGLLGGAEVGINIAAVQTTAEAAQAAAGVDSTGYPPANLVPSRASELAAVLVEEAADPLTGPAMQVCLPRTDRLAATDAYAFLSDTPVPDVTAGAIDIRIDLTPIDDGGGSHEEGRPDSFAEVCSLGHGNPDGLEAAVAWINGQPYAYFEWTEPGGSAEVAQLIAAVLVPGVASRLRFTIEEDDGEGHGRARIWRACSSSADDVTTDGTWWRIVAEKVLDAPTALIPGMGTPGAAPFDGLPAIGLGVGPTRVYAVSIRDGLDGTVTCQPDIANASPGATTVPDLVLESAPGVPAVWATTEAEVVEIAASTDEPTAPVALVATAPQSVTNTTTATALTALSTPVVAGRTYRLDATLLMDGPNTDARLGITGPSGTVAIGVSGLGAAASAVPGNALVAGVLVAVDTYAVVGLIGAGTPAAALMSGTYTPATSGTLALTFAQNGTSVDPTTVRTGSSLVLTPIT